MQDKECVCGHSLFTHDEEWICWWIHKDGTICTCMKFREYDPVRSSMRMLSLTMIGAAVFYGGLMLWWWMS